MTSVASLLIYILLHRKSVESITDKPSLVVSAMFNVIYVHMST